MTKRLDSFRIVIDEGIPGTEEEFKIFQSDTKERIKFLMEVGRSISFLLFILNQYQHADDCTSWVAALRIRDQEMTDKRNRDIDARYGNLIMSEYHF